MKITIRDMVETAMLVAIAIILDREFLKIRIFPAGGSISFTMLPLFILALRLGTPKSFIGIGIIYALITCLLDQSPAYAIPLDYICAYGSISLIGLFKNKIIVKEAKFSNFLFLSFGVIFCCILRLVFSTISGVIFYQPITFVQSLLYNALYIGPSSGIVLIAMLILYKPFLKINERYPLKSI